MHYKLINWTLYKIIANNKYICLYLWRVGLTCGELTYRLWGVAYIHVSSWFCGKLDARQCSSNSLK